MSQSLVLWNAQYHHLVQTGWNGGISRASLWLNCYLENYFETMTCCLLDVNISCDICLHDHWWDQHIEMVHVYVWGWIVGFRTNDFRWKAWMRNVELKTKNINNYNFLYGYCFILKLPFKSIIVMCIYVMGIMWCVLNCIYIFRGYYFYT